MKPLAAFPPDARRAICGVLCDIDDTLSSEGRITAQAYDAMERLHRAGLLLVPVTGRPAGWCDHIARMWPVDGVVGENGAFYFRYDRVARKMNRHYANDFATRAQHREQLMHIAREIIQAVPGSAIAADQQYRETDLAIDYCEDVAPLPMAAVDQIVARMAHHGLTAKVSSIHVNGWFGRYDKLGMSRTLMREAFDVNLDVVRERYVFVGDSPNDAPMFAYFPHAVGVANMLDFGARVTALPAYISQQRCGAGFAEVAACLLHERII
jgi:HAD superfamily hydrolase (TIGR01484 family)